MSNRLGEMDLICTLIRHIESYLKLRESYELGHPALFGDLFKLRRSLGSQPQSNGKHWRFRLTDVLYNLARLKVIGKKPSINIFSQTQFWSCYYSHN